MQDRTKQRDAGHSKSADFAFAEGQMGGDQFPSELYV